MSNPHTESKKLYAAATKLCARKKCSRCNGSGMWTSLDRGGVCYKCGGVGEVLIWNAAATALHKAAHVLEVEELLTQARTFLAAEEAKAAATGRKFGLKITQERVARLEAQLASMKA